MQEIFKHGAAYKDGRLQEGDQLLEVNEYKLKILNQLKSITATRSITTSQDLLINKSAWQEIRIRIDRC